MKRIVLAVLVVSISAAGVQAQTDRITNKAVPPEAANAKRPAARAGSADSSATGQLVSTSTHQAYGVAGRSQFFISDPIVNLFRQRANNAPVTFNGRDVVGVPGSTYGIAHGRILLRSTTAAAPGTSYGSGAVGTGTTQLGVGTGENAISVNGKSPYAGPWLWGGKHPSVNLAPFLRQAKSRGQ